MRTEMRPVSQTPGLTGCLPARRSPVQDTLRDCTHDERSCLSSLQFVSPLYFVSFVLTAQFVLINVVVAVLMKHLDDSNKEAQEDAEMDAELELEMAHSLGPSPRPPAGSPGAPAPAHGPGGAGSEGDPEGRLRRSCYSPAQVGGARRGQRGRRGLGRQLGLAGRGRARAESSVVPGPTRSAPFQGRPCDVGSGPGHGRRTRKAARARPPGHPEPTDNPTCPHPVPVRLGEPVAGQRLFNHQGLLGGGADHHRQPVRVHLPPLLLAGRLREVSPRQTGGNGSAPKGAGASGLGVAPVLVEGQPEGRAALAGGPPGPT